MEEAKKKSKGSRSRTSSTTETRSRSGSTSSTRGSSMTSTTTDLMEESSKMKALAAMAAAKAQQRKMTDFLGTSEQGSSKTQGQGQALLGGAGELPSGPCDPAAAAAQGKDPADVEVDRIQEQIRVLRDQQEQAVKKKQQEQQAAEAAKKAAAQDPQRTQGGASGGSSDEASRDDAEGGWKIWTNRKNRRVGEELGQGDPRQVREKTPFRLPGQQLPEGRGYYTSTARRLQAQADQARSNKSSAVAALSDRQWFWFKQKLCLHCGMGHQVKNCPDLTKDESYALLRAALDCPVDMRPYAQGRRGPRPQGQGGAGAGPSTSSSERAPPPPPPKQPEATKRSRDNTEASSSGLTPEAKRAKQFSEALKSGFTLHVREKDGSALSEGRYNSLKTSFAYFVEDMMTKNKDPPICAGRWAFSRSVVRIPMAGETDTLWMRCFLEKTYLVQTEQEFNRSKGKVYVAYLRDRTEAELTGMRPDKLATFIGFYRKRMGIEGLFDLKMAAKTPKGKAVHLVMDEKAEETFVKAGCKIPFAGAGWIIFEDRATYVARIKAQERNRYKPKSSTLEKGLLEQKMDVSNMSVDDEVVEVGRKPAEKAVEAAEREERRPPATEEHKELAKLLRGEVRGGFISLSSAEAKIMEESGWSLDELAPLPRRTESSTSWSEEVEMAKRLDVPEAVEEEGGDDDDEDQALFELGRESAQVDHRAAGSAGPSS